MGRSLRVAPVCGTDALAMDHVHPFAGLRFVNGLLNSRAVASGGETTEGTTVVLLFNGSSLCEDRRASGEEDAA